MSQKAILQPPSLSVSTKRAVYCPVIMSVLLYGAETWSRNMDQKYGPPKLRIWGNRSFHSQCIRTILGVTKYQQWRDLITPKQLASEFGLGEPIDDIFMVCHLRWLGHLGHMGKRKTTKEASVWWARKKRDHARDKEEVAWWSTLWPVGYW